eukprot:5362886-Prymnesium_polylepis.1
MKTPKVFHRRTELRRAFGRTRGKGQLLQTGERGPGTWASPWPSLEVSRSLRVGQCVRRRCRRGPRQRLYALSIQPTSNWLEASAQTSKSSKSTTHLSQEITQVVVGSAALYADHWHSEHNS